MPNEPSITSNLVLGGGICDLCITHKVLYTHVINLIGMKSIYSLVAQLHLFVLLDFIKKWKWMVEAPNLEPSNPNFLLFQTLGYSSYCYPYMI